MINFSKLISLRDSKIRFWFSTNIIASRRKIKKICSRYQTKINRDKSGGGILIAAIKVEMMIRVELLSGEVISLSSLQIISPLLLRLPRKTIITLFLRHGQLERREQLEYFYLLSPKNYHTFPFSCSLLLREHTHAHWEFLQRYFHLLTDSSYYWFITCFTTGNERRLSIRYAAAYQATLMLFSLCV